MSLIKKSLSFWSNLNVGLIWGYEAKFREKKIISRLSNEVPFKLWHIRSGKVEIEDEINFLLAEPGQWVIPGMHFKKHVIHAGTEFLSIALRVDLESGRSLFKNVQALVFEEKPLEKNRSLLRVTEDLVKWGNTHGGPQHIGQPKEFGALSFSDFRKGVSLCLECVDKVLNILDREDISFGSRKIQDQRLRLVITLMERASLDRFPSKEMLMKTSCLSWRRLEQLFREEMGISPKGFFDRRRLNGAKARLEDPSYQVKTVAYELGFREVSHFSNWFKKATGISPVEYRRGHDFGV